MFGLFKKKEEFCEKDLHKAKLLLDAAKVFASTFYYSALKEYPELEEIINARLLDFWEYLFTIAGVGCAFAEIVDTLPRREQKGTCYAVKKVLDDWDDQAYFAMSNFINSVMKDMDNGLDMDIATGAWIWANLKHEDTATPKIGHMAHEPRYAQMAGFPLLNNFHGWWTK